ncbi:hypothetical protein EB796_004114 [Bugula neritina]|nr:hypothetical protein EB796_004114 [Bugula neritina]
MEIATIMKERKLFPFFDLAYQGFSSGDLESDAWSVRYFASLGFDMFCAQSFSKNFGLYNDRVGLLAIIVSDQSHIAIAKSHVELIGRRVHASSPHHGARIVSTILNNQALREEWKGCVTKMATRIKLMRQKLYQKLVVLGTPGSWEHVVQQNGMFFYSGLNVRQVEFLTKEYHIYLLKSGRINMCGLTLENMDYVANAIHEAVTNIHDEPEV